MSLYDKIVNGKEKISVVGLGYVGLPLAVAFAKKAEVIGFDTNREKIELYKSGIDPTGEAGDEEVKNTSLYFTADAAKLREAKFHIVAVPTPTNIDNTPNLDAVETASRIVGENLTKGSVVVFESTVYPGVTEEVCVPVMEAASGMVCGRDFKVGYSPERINPGDKVHRPDNIVKVVSGMDEETLDIVSRVYDMVVTAGTFRVSSIKTAEAVKIAENSQRDVNIAFMNELAMAFDKMGIDTAEVIAGMNTKWNALGFYPGLVGGHCIGVDPYYFIYRAERLGYHSRIIQAGRSINDSMGEYIADAAVKEMILAEKAPAKATAVILGVTFKENCRDIRNSKVRNIIARLHEYGVKTIVADSAADPEEVRRVYNTELTELDGIHDADCIIAAVSHDEYKGLGIEDFEKMYKKTGTRVFVDVKSMYDKKMFTRADYRYWRL